MPSSGDLENGLGAQKSQNGGKVEKISPVKPKGNGTPPKGQLVFDLLIGLTMLAWGLLFANKLWGP